MLHRKCEHLQEYEWSVCTGIGNCSATNMQTKFDYVELQSNALMCCWAPSHISLQHALRAVATGVSNRMLVCQLSENHAVQ